jgi:uncharacterized protein (DUF4415 family)
MSKIVRKRWDENKITAKRKRELAELAARPDSEIDHSEIPQLTEKFWQKAVRNPFYRPLKKQVTVRIDADVLEWLKSTTQKGYQSRMNLVLREAMLRTLH